MNFTRIDLCSRTQRMSASWILAATITVLAAPNLGLAQNILPASVPALVPSRPLGHTPVQVLDGSATMIEHYDPSKPLRITIGLTPPHMDEARQLIDRLPKRTHRSSTSG